MPLFVDLQKMARALSQLAQKIFSSVKLEVRNKKRGEVVSVYSVSRVCGDHVRYWRVRKSTTLSFSTFHEAIQFLRYVLEP